MTTCLYCEGLLNYKGTGRIPVFCCNACKQANYRLKKNNFVRVRPNILTFLRAAPYASIREMSDFRGEPLRNTVSAVMRANPSQPLRNTSGAALSFEPLRNSGIVFKQVDWVEVLQ